MKGVGMAMREFVDAELSPLRERIAELEARPTMKYAGVFDRTRSYKAGAVVTYQGSAWVANLESKGVRPGDGAAWQLMVKRGKDAR
jgi:hypothetical protein